ncbi:MAG: DUF4013 domain-containing protein [Halolamina sp.]
MLRQLRAALRAPVADPDFRLGTVLLGGLALAGRFIPLVAAVPMVGYLARVAAATARAEAAPGRTDVDAPDPTRLRSLAVDGVRGGVAVVVFLLPPAALLSVTVGPAVEQAVAFDGSERLFLPLAAVSTLSVAVAVAYPLPAVLALVGHAGRLRAGFDRTALWRAVRSARYLTNVLAGAASLAVATALGRPLFDVAVGYFILAYGLVVAAHLWGDGSGAAVGGVTSRVGGSDEPPATSDRDEG